MTLVAGGMAGAQADLDRVAGEQAVEARVQHLMELGLEREAATLIAVLRESGMSPAEILMLVTLSEKGGDDAGGVMLLLNAMKNAAPRQPVVIDRGAQLLIVEGGTLYVIDLATMQVSRRLSYTQEAEDALWRFLIPVIAQGGGPQLVDEATEVCQTHLALLGEAFRRYVDDKGVLPGEEWVAQITPLLGEGHDALRCPSREQAVAFALNEKLVGLAPDEVGKPAETILLFETALDGDSPVGGPEALPEEGVHNGGVNVLMVNGEVRWLSPAEARERLGRPVGR
jgi:hypothetical protein